MKKILIAGVLLALGSAASAAELSFNNVEIGYGYADFDCDTNCDYVGLGAGFEVGEHFIVGVGGAISDGNDSVGGSFGGRWNVAETTALYATVGATHSDFGTDGTVGVGVKSMLSDSFELDFGVSHIFVPGGATGADVTGTYFFNDTTGVSVSLNGGEGAFGGGLGLRFNF